MRLYPDSELSRLIYVSDFEAAEQDFLRAYLRQGDVFVDVGANIGFHTVLAGYCVGESGIVFAFEPSGRAFSRLVDNVELNGLRNVECRKEAISDVVGCQILKSSTGRDDAWNTLGSPIRSGEFVDELVQCTTIDEFVASKQLLERIDLIKVDVEGWESHVLRGGASIFSGPDAPMLLVEFTDENAIAAGASCQDLYRILEDFGYGLYVYHPKSHTLIRDPLRDRYPYVNLIAVKKPEDAMHRIAKQDGKASSLPKMRWLNRIRHIGTPCIA